MKDSSKVGLFGIVATVALGWAACSSAPTSSKLVGKVAQETFASPVTRAVISADDGSSSRVAVAADGTFELVLDKGRTYQVTLEGGEVRTPLIFAGSRGKYLTRLAVPSGGAVANVGLVRFFANGQGLMARSIVANIPVPGDCVDGFFAGTDEPCIFGVATSTCEDDDGDSDSDSDGDSNENHHAEGNHSDENHSDEDDGGDDDGDHQNFQNGDEDVVGGVAVPEGGLTTLGCDHDDDDGDSDEDSDSD